MAKRPNRFGISLPRGRRTVVKSRGGAVEVAFTGVNLADYAESLRQVARRGQNLQPALEEFGQYLIGEHIPGQFAAQGTPKRWAPLSQKYAEWKRRKYGSLPILVLTGAMRAGFRFKAGPRSLQIVNTAKRRGGKPHWQYHQFGTSRMPARPVLQVVTGDRQVLRDMVLSYLIAQTSGAGL